MRLLLWPWRVPDIHSKEDFIEIHSSFVHPAIRRQALSKHYLPIRGNKAKETCRSTETMNCICSDGWSSPGGHHCSVKPQEAERKRKTRKGRYGQNQFQCLLYRVRYERWGGSVKQHRQTKPLVLFVWMMYDYLRRETRRGGVWRVRAGSEGNRNGCTHDQREAGFPGKTCEGPLHAYLTLSSQACMKHDKCLFAIQPTSPPPRSGVPLLGTGLHWEK